MNRVNIQPQALTDVEEAAAWYETQQNGLGTEFVLELDAAVERATANPTIYEIQYLEARRVLLRRFPYSVYFIYERDVVEVFAVLHQHSAPSAWQGRTP